MTVTINGKQQEIAEGTTIAMLAEQLHLGRTGVAVARNNRIVPHSEWNTKLFKGDAVVIINASCGG